jgi:hypothetical protein
MEPIDRVLRMTTVEDDGCWLWRGALTHYGYGVVNTQQKIHRVTFEHFTGTIPDGLVIDHLCRVRHCVNPDHLEAVTFAQNVLRGDGPPAQNARRTHCKNGHELAGDNLKIIETKTGAQRRCRSCEKAYMAAWYAERQSRG